MERNKRDTAPRNFLKFFDKKEQNLVINHTTPPFQNFLWIVFTFFWIPVQILIIDHFAKKLALQKIHEVNTLMAPAI